MPGTGRVVMYIVTQRYKYRVPMRKKNRLLAIDLKMDIMGDKIDISIFLTLFSMILSTSFRSEVFYSVGQIKFNCHTKKTPL